MSELQNITEVKKESIGKKSVSRYVIDIIAALVCIITATFIWFSVSEDAKTSVSKQFTVDIEIENNSNYLLLANKDETVEITVSGRPSVISSLSESDFKFYVVIPSSAVSGNARYDIEYSALPKGVTLESKTRQTVSLTLAEMVTREFNITCQLQDMIVSEPYSIDYVLDTSVVKVTGAEIVVDKIKDAVVTVKDVGTVTGSFTASGEVCFYDENGDIISKNITQNVKTVTVSVTAYKETDIPVTVSFVNGYFSSQNCNIKIEPQSIKVKGSVAELGNLNLDFKIDEMTLTDGKNTLEFDVNLPDGVENVSGDNKITVTVDTVGITTRKITLSGDAIKFKNPDNLNHSEISSITVTVRGDQKSVSAMTAESITATVDISALSVGAHTVNATVTVADELRNSVYIVGDYPIMVKITQ